MHKIKYLDGVRGLAALFVVLSHFVVAFYPALYNSDPGQAHTSNAVELLIAKSPINLLYNGNFAVCVFFILSGYVLSYRYFSTEDSEAVVASAVKRYFRLLVPVLVSVFIVALLMKFSLFYNKEAAELTFSNWWLGSFWRFDLTFLHAAKSVFFNIFFKHDDQYNTVLWTMTYEMYGSLLVFGFIALFGNIRRRYVFYIIAIVLLLKTYYLGFILGMILSDVNTKIHFYKTTNKHLIVKFILLTIGLYFGSYPTAANVQHSVYKYLETTTNTTVIVYHMIGAFITMLVLLRSSHLQKFFSLRLFDFLGKVSFSLYLIHVIVIGSFTSYVFVLLNEHMGYSVSFLLSFLLSVPLILILSYLMYKYVDKKGITLANLLYERFFKTSFKVNANDK